MEQLYYIDCMVNQNPYQISYLTSLNYMVEIYSWEKREDRGYEFLYIIFNHCIVHGERYDKEYI